MMKKTYWVAGLLLLLQTTFGALDANASSRAVKKFGVAVGLLTEPLPSTVGFSASYNLAHFLRLGVGYGSFSFSSTAYTLDITTIGVDAKVFPLDWNFSPYASIGFTSISGTISGTGEASGLSLTSTGGAITYGAGIDWQTYLGFNLGVAYKIISKNGASAGIPGFYIGWFF